MYTEKDRVSPINNALLEKLQRTLTCRFHDIAGLNVKFRCIQSQHFIDLSKLPFTDPHSYSVFRGGVQPLNEPFSSLVLNLFEYFFTFDLKSHTVLNFIFKSLIRQMKEAKLYFVVRGIELKRACLKRVLTDLMNKLGKLMICENLRLFHYADWPFLLLGFF